MTAHLPSRVRRAFSLIELLVILGILVILIALIVPAFSSRGHAQAITSSARRIVDHLELARQTATTRNRPVEVRFYKLPPADSKSGAPEDYRALQLFVVEEDRFTPASKITYLVQPVVISTNPAHSSLMDEGALPEAAVPSGESGVPQNARYRAFRFRSDGSTDLARGEPWFLTLVAKNAPADGENGLPKNYATVQIEPTIGRARFQQP